LEEVRKLGLLSMLRHRTRRRVAIMGEEVYHNELFNALASAVWV
jgi:hypothetical protein